MTNTTYPPSGFKPDSTLAQRQLAWETRIRFIPNTTNGGK